MGEEKIRMKDTFKRLVITFQANSLQVFQDEDESETTTLPIGPGSQPGYSATWGAGHLAFGGLLGEVIQRFIMCLIMVCPLGISLRVAGLDYCSERDI